jgi:hypothetical protein
MGGLFCSIPFRVFGEDARGENRFFVASVSRLKRHPTNAQINLVTAEDAADFHGAAVTDLDWAEEVFEAV